MGIGAHLDDVELGCGGSLTRHVLLGDDVYVSFASISGLANQHNQEVRPNKTALNKLS